MVAPLARHLPIHRNRRGSIPGCGADGEGFVWGCVCDAELIFYRNFEMAEAYMEQMEHWKRAYKGSIKFWLTFRSQIVLSFE